ncbi:MAG: TPM domain-containing protein [Bacteroidales bacterium]|nr:TPM domain-containing protein [Bacteroidales bacterium]
MKARQFLTKEEQKAVVSAIMDAERATSGEIRVHIETSCSGDPKIRALRTFHKLRMTRTAARNGVLVYVACDSRRFAVIGDKGINAKVQPGFWKDVVALMGAHFSKEEYAAGLIDGIGLIGEKLKAFFPYMSDDVNELPDDISYGDGE